MTQSKKTLMSGVLWSFFGQFAYMLVGFIGNVFLARLLSPSEFGQVGIVMFFVLLAGVLSESGFSGALIRMKDVKEEDYSTIFIFNFLVSLVLFLVLILFSGTIAAFYNDFDLKYILIALSSILLINSFQIIQNAKLVREMKFKKRAIYKFVSLSLATIIALTMAFKGFGVWSIVTLQILSSFFLTLLYLIFEKRINKLVFNINSFREMYSFGLNTTLASVLNSVFENVYQLILGKYFSINQSGLYYQAKRLQDVPDSLFKIVSLNVVYSHLSKLQDDKKQFLATYSKIAIFSASIVGFTSSLAVLYADQIILNLYGEKWIESAFFLKLLAVSSFFYLQEIINRNIFKVFNQTQKILYLELIKKAIQLITILIGIYYLRIDYLIFGFMITSVVSYGINYFYSQKIIDNSHYLEILSVLKVVLISSITIGIIILSATFFKLTGNYMLFLFPLFFTIYFYLLKYSNTFNLIKEVKLIIFRKNAL